MLSENRDKSTARAFFDKAISTNGIPEKITIDKSGANKSGLDVINLRLATSALIQIIIRQIKYLNNIVESDHRFIKRITKPMMGFQSFETAKATIAGIELHHMLRKKQNASVTNQPIFEQFYALAE